MVQIESKIEFDLTFMEYVLCVFGTTYWVLGRHNKYQKWFYRNCYNVIWFFIGWSRAIKCNLPMVFNTSRSKTPNFSRWKNRLWKNFVHYFMTRWLVKTLREQHWMEFLDLHILSNFIISFSGVFSHFTFVFVLTFLLSFALVSETF